LPTHCANSTQRHFHALLRARVSRRTTIGMIAGGALLAPASRAMAAQEAPPIEPIQPGETIGPEATGPPVESDNPVIEPPAPTPTTAPDASSAEIVQQEVATGEQYFAETGHNLGDPFLNTWKAAGGRGVLGLPLSEARFVDGAGQIQQTFETLTLAYDPTLEAPWTIQALHLESSVITRIAPDAARRKVSGPAAGGEFFAESGHTLSGRLLAFWKERGAMQLFGLPLSEPFRSGKVTSQAFERVIMDEAANGDVSLRKLGPDWMKAEGLEGDAAFIAAPPNRGVTSLVSASDGLRLRAGASGDAETLVVLPDNAEFIAAPGDHNDWVPGYVDGYAGWVSAEFLKTPPTVETISLAEWDATVWQGVALGETNVRREPTTVGPEASVLQHGDPVIVVDWVEGEEVFEGANIWAKLKDGSYIYARNVGRSAPVAPPPLPADAPWDGKWIDVQLTQQLMVAYEGRTPVRTVVATTGMPGWETPTGWFAISRRVANETMESGAIGAEQFFKLEDVLFTQYFTDRGHALHYAWWRTPETIGRPGSHGCLNMLLDDSRFFWDWATIGTPVIVRTA
jgi:hypothetical protein